MTPDTRITRLEEALTHAQLQIEELNAEVVAQADRIALMERQLAMIAQWAASQDAGDNGAGGAGQKPPHY